MVDRENAIGDGIRHRRGKGNIRRGISARFRRDFERGCRVLRSKEAVQRAGDFEFVLGVCEDLRRRVRVEEEEE